jgi:DNA-directed RNA polymerase I subunit RPA12
MAWPFCPQCGTILDPPEVDKVVCSYCPFKCRYEDMGVSEVVTHSAPKQKPAWLGDEEDDDNNESKHATIEEPCPKCGHPELYFYTLQLRSVDEGSTVFYECPKCSHKYSQNN